MPAISRRSAAPTRAMAAPARSTSFYAAVGSTQPNRNPPLLNGKAGGSASVARPPRIVSPEGPDQQDQQPAAVGDGGNRLLSLHLARLPAAAWARPADRLLGRPRPVR